MSKTGVELALIGQDGNAFSILGRASNALKRAGLYQEHWDSYHAEATSGDYNQLLLATMEYFICDADTESDDDGECFNCGRVRDLYPDLCTECMEEEDDEDEQDDD